ncbi:MAG: hypothetical protein U5R31_11125 [Acidimicrobiia bacterium]|nr:hypothetical protein [Acidimicrobiia bacterium]
MGDADRDPASRLVAVVTSVVSALALVTLGPLPVASAHGGAGTIEVLSQEQTGPRQLSMQVEIRYVLDDHAAVPATFTVSGTSADGGTVGPVDLTRTATEGVYDAVIDFPSTGDWSLTFSSTLPPSEHALRVSVTDTTSSTIAPPTVPEGDGGPNGPGDAPTGGESDGESGAETVAEGGSGPPGVLLAGLVVSGVLVVAGVVGVLVVRRRPAP